MLRPRPQQPSPDRERALPDCQGEQPNEQGTCTGKELSLPFPPTPQKREFDVDNLSKQELRMLLSVMEGELEARDLVIEALRGGQSSFPTLQHEQKAKSGHISGEH
ncbi:Cortactin-binding protein 2 [Chelonia mydas]|uniref:Cortactin-binding protein 2 n=1 Tax=Chelonia mydas TaxID=8469 RepID=M7C1K7_CHEMY|nr:Cortactin-binding protein 2 [Chelonia mydas]